MLEKIGRAFVSYMFHFSDNFALLLSHFNDAWRRLGTRRSSSNGRRNRLLLPSVDGLRSTWRRFQRRPRWTPVNTGGSHASEAVRVASGSPLKPVLSAPSPHPITNRVPWQRPLAASPGGVPWRRAPVARCSYWMWIRSAGRLEPAQLTNPTYTFVFGCWVRWLSRLVLPPGPPAHPPPPAPPLGRKQTEISNLGQGFRIRLHPTRGPISFLKASEFRRSGHRVDPILALADNLQTLQTRHLLLSFILFVTSAPLLRTRRSLN